MVLLGLGRWKDNDKSTYHNLPFVDADFSTKELAIKGKSMIDGRHHTLTLWCDGLASASVAKMQPVAV